MACDGDDDRHYYIIEIKKVVGFYDPLFSVLVYPELLTEVRPPHPPFLVCFY